MLSSFRFANKYLDTIFKKKLNRNCVLKKWKHTKDNCPSPVQEKAEICSQLEPKVKLISTENCPRILPEELFDLHCKTTVVIGGEEGIGYATANALLTHKAKVVGIFGKNINKGMDACKNLNTKFGKRKAVFYRVDVTCISDIECAICKCAKDFGKIDTFINTFGICDGRNWENEINVNLLGMVKSTILAHKYLAKSNSGGIIVNTAGIFGFIPSAGCPITSTAQHGIIGLSKSFGKHELYKESNVRVVTLCPGLTDTALFKKAATRTITPFMGKYLAEEIKSMKKQRPEVCGSSVIWLLKYAESGTVWLIEDGKLYKIHCKLPHSCSELFLEFAS